MEDKDLPSKDIEKLQQKEYLPVEYMLRRVPQEGLEEEPVDRISEAFENKYTGAYMHIFCRKEQQVMWSCIQKFIVCTVVYDTQKVADKSFIVCIGL